VSDTQYVRLSVVLEVPAKDAKAANDLLGLVLEKFFRVNALETQHYDAPAEAMRDYDIAVHAVVSETNKRHKS
jgi:hypothetical protein